MLPRVTVALAATGAAALSSRHELIHGMIKGEHSVGSALIQKEMDAHASHLDLQQLEMPKDIKKMLKHKGKKGHKKLRGHQVLAHSSKKKDDDPNKLAMTRLSDMMGTEFEALDAILIKCKIFHDNNRKLAEVLGIDKAMLESGALEMQGLYDTSAAQEFTLGEEIANVDAEFESQEAEVGRVRAEDQADLDAKVANQGIMELIMEATKCPEGGLLLNQEKATMEHKMLVCKAHGNSQLTYRFADKALQAKLDLLFAKSHVASERFMRAVEGFKLGPKGYSLLQTSATVTKQDPAGTTPPSSDAADQPRQARKCTADRVNCAKLYDEMSVLWGEAKDAVDLKSAEMDEKAAEWEKIKENFIAEKELLAELQSAEQQLQLDASEAKAVKEKTATEKGEQLQVVHHEYVEFMNQCTMEIEKIMFDKYCGLKLARKEIAKNAELEDATDCQVEEWKNDGCSKTDEEGNECDDACDITNPESMAQCGGTGRMSREVAAKPSGCWEGHPYQTPKEGDCEEAQGQKCPTLDTERSCGKIPCPKDCVQTEWSEPGACTKSCGGGTETSYRKIESDPAFGGAPCGGLTSLSSCNEHSCDVDCQLENWTSWSGCTQACSPDGIEQGLKQKFRHVFEPAKGEGMCADEKDISRYEEESCNGHICEGDEECIAEADVIIALDASGSISVHDEATVKGSAWSQLKNFTEEVANRYDGSALGGVKTKMGFILFGNGGLEEDGTVTPAIKKSGLVEDLDSVRAMIKDAEFQGGFTNMAQVFTEADPIFLEGRPEAQSIVLVITDGYSSFKVTTGWEAEKLRRKGVHINFVVIQQDRDSESQQWLKEAIVSEPASAHFYQIEGWNKMSSEPAKEAQNVIVRNCPLARSVIADRRACEAKKFTLFKWGYDCPNWWGWLGIHRTGADCLGNALAHEARSFVQAPQWTFTIWIWTFTIGGECFTRNDGGPIIAYEDWGGDSEEAIENYCDWQPWWAGNVYRWFMSGWFDTYLVAICDRIGDPEGSAAFYLEDKKHERADGEAVDRDMNKFEVSHEGRPTIEKAIELGYLKSIPAGYKDTRRKIPKGATFKRLH